MIIYIVLLALVFMYGLIPYHMHNSQQSEKIFLILSFTTMILILGLRGNSVGEDTNHYIKIFNYSANVQWNDMLHSTGMRTVYYVNQYGYKDTVENGFLAICKFVHFFTDNAQVFLFFIGSVTCCLFAKFIYDNCGKVFFPTLVFLCESMYMFSFNGIRQMLAVAITLQAYTFLRHRQLKKAVAVILSAALIHNVALIALVLIPVMYLKTNKGTKSFKYVIAASILTPLAIVYFSNIVVKIFPRYESYFTVNYWTNSIGGSALLYLVEIVLVIVMYMKNFKMEQSYQLAILILLFLACEIFGLRMTMFSRVGWFFRAYLILFFQNGCLYFSGKTKKYIILGIGALLILLFISYARTPYRQYSFC